jgi:hypothetical protein
MYNYFLGGKDNYPADRDAAEQVIAASPGILLFARENRAFLRRVVRWLVTGCGIGQFIDIGTGLPADGNVHEVAQAIDPGIRVVYVDHDPVVLAHSRDMLNNVRGTAIIQRDLLDPAAIFADAELRELIRFEEPVAVMLLAVVHFIGGDAGPVISGLLEPLAPGSYLVISHGTADRDPDAVPEAAAVQKIYRESTTSVRPRSRDEIMALLGGLDIVDPGLVWGPLWRPDPGTGITGNPAAANMYAVVARKPLPAARADPSWPPPVTGPRAGSDAGRLRDFRRSSLAARRRVNRHQLHFPCGAVAPGDSTGRPVMAVVPAWTRFPVAGPTRTGGSSTCRPADAGPCSSCSTTMRAQAASKILSPCRCEQRGQVSSGSAIPSIPSRLDCQGAEEQTAILPARNRADLTHPEGASRLLSALRWSRIA